MSKTPVIKPTLNQADIDLLMQNIHASFPTKAELNQRFAVVDSNFIETNQRLEEMDKQQFIKYDNVITLLDDIAGELKIIREEQTIMSHQLAGHTDQIASTKSNLKNHEKRIDKLELAANFA